MRFQGQVSLSLRRITAVTLVVGACLTTSAFLLTKRGADANEMQLLQQQSGAAATVLAADVAQTEQAVRRAGFALEFRRTVKAPGTTRDITAGAALLRMGPGGLTTVASTGTLQASLPAPGEPGRPAWMAAVPDAPVYTRPIGSGAHRVVGVAIALTASDVVYAELSTNPSGQSAGAVSRTSAAAAFAKLDFALYVGPSQSSSELVAADTTALPLPQPRATVVLTGRSVAAPDVSGAPASAEPGQLVLVMTPHGALGGILDVSMPWTALAVGLLATGLLAASLEANARRRDRALALAGALQSSEQSYRQLFADNPQPMWAYDLETLGFLDVNDAAVAKYGYSRDEFLAMRITDIRPQEDVDKLLANLRERRPAGIDSSGPWRHRLRNGRLIDVAITSHMQEFGDRPAVLVAVRDITVERAMEARLQHFALHDPLTGAENRQMFMSNLATMLEAREARSCALLLVDVSATALLDNGVGRDGADELLVAVCDRITSAAGEPAHVARIGGEVFAVARGDLSDGAAALTWAETVHAAVVRPLTLRQRRLAVAARTGLALGEAGLTERELLHHGDVALALAQPGGDDTSGHVAQFDAERDRQRRDRLDIEADLRAAVAAGQLTLLYQPQVDLSSRRVTGVEALVRWPHPTRGMLPPSLFLPVAEDCGLMSAIDAWVLDEACAQSRRWLDRGVPPLTMSVNISAHDVESGPQLVELVRLALQRHRLPGHALEIELTETVALRDRDEAETVFTELRALGVRVALDDFGTGYSMLDRVRDLPLDRVKIDRTFVRRATTGGAALLDAMVAMARSLDLEVVAEGVETEQELELVARSGCAAVQGFLFSKPVSPDDIESMLTAEFRSVAAATR